MHDLATWTSTVISTTFDAVRIIPNGRLSFDVYYPVLPRAATYLNIIALQSHVIRGPLDLITILDT
jgi:hypothetical protein